MYKLLENQLLSIFEGTDDFITNASNFSALIISSLSDLNWVGFYMMSKDSLRLSIFQGNTACIKIAIGQGVCGKSAELKEILVVDDVHKFPGHIACDESSNSEIVIPLIVNDVLFGVFDLDSTILNRFSDEDKIGLKRLLTILIKSSNMDRIYKYYNE
jgi:GAF domain-containing protein